MADNNNTATASTSVSFAGLLGVVLVVLKLNPGGLLTTPVVDWSWWLVLLPFYAGLLLLLLILLVGAIVVGIGELGRKRRYAKRRAEQRRRLGR